MTSQLAELAVWLTGEEPPEQIERWKADVANKLKELEERDNARAGPITWTIKYPGEDRVPPVPDNIHGVDVRLLVAECEVWPLKPKITRQTGFIYDLTKEDRAKLRRLTREAHAKSNPGNRLNNKQCDAVIEHLGPDVALRTLRGEKIN